MVRRAVDEAGAIRGRRAARAIGATPPKAELRDAPKRRRAAVERRMVDYMMLIWSVNRRKISGGPSQSNKACGDLCWSLQLCSSLRRTGTYRYYVVAPRENPRQLLSSSALRSRSAFFRFIRGRVRFFLREASGLFLLFGLLAMRPLARRPLFALMSPSIVHLLDQLGLTIA